MTRVRWQKKFEKRWSSSSYKEYNSKYIYSWYNRIWHYPVATLYNRKLLFICLFVCLFVCLTSVANQPWESYSSLINYSRTSFIRTPGDYQNPFVLSKFVLTSVICIESTLKGTKIVFNREFALIVFVLTRFYCMYIIVACKFVYNGYGCYE